MKIALLHYSVPPIVGGVESVLGQHARLMAEAGHQVQLVAGHGAQLDARVPFIEIPLLDSRNDEVLAVKSILDTGHIPDAFEPLVQRMAAQLGQALTDVDVLIAHNVCSLNKNLALTAALRLLLPHSHRRLILWHHDLAWTTPRYRAELHAGYPWDLLRTDWPTAAHVVVSDLRRDELAGLLRIPKARIEVIPNGIDPGSFLKLEAWTQAYVKQLDLWNAMPLLLLPVRITPRKNIELALHVLAELRKQHPRASLVITGPLGPHNPANLQYFERLIALRAQLGLAASAHFLAERTDEYLPDAVIADFYRLADALFLPSREEGFGIPILEAGLAGLPVFCSDIAPLQKLGARDAVYFSPDADPAQVAERIANHLSSQSAFGLRVRVRQDYTWDGIYSQHIAPLLQK